MYKDQIWKSKVAMFDIETTALPADFGIMMVACVKPYGKKPITFRIDKFNGYEKDKTDDRAVCLALKHELMSYDIIISFYGKKFDRPFLNTRLITNGCSPLYKMPHIDYYFVSKFQLKLSHNSLMAVTRLCNHGKSDKTHIPPGVWLKAMTGNTHAIDYMVDHCRRDVCDLEKIHDRLWELLPEQIRKG